MTGPYWTTLDARALAQQLTQQELRQLAGVYSNTSDDNGLYEDWRAVVALALTILAPLLPSPTLRPLADDECASVAKTWEGFSLGSIRATAGMNAKLAELFTTPVARTLREVKLNETMSARFACTDSSGGHWFRLNTDTRRNYNLADVLGHAASERMFDVALELHTLITDPYLPLPPHIPTTDEMIAAEVRKLSAASWMALAAAFHSGSGTNDALNTIATLVTPPEAGK